MKRSAIQEHTRKIRKEAEALGPAKDLSCVSWEELKSEKIATYYVRAITDGVRRSRFPTGKDKGPLTHALEYLLDHPYELPDLKVAQLENFIKAMGFDQHAPIVIPGAEHPDEEAVERWQKPLSDFHVTYAGEAARAAKAAGRR